MAFICNTTDIPETEAISLKLGNPDDSTPQCFETDIEINGRNQPVFLFRHDGEVKAFINACPHTGARLNWQPGVFLDSEQYYIQCSIHGALFEKDSGLCVHGPCIKQHLQRINITEQEGKIFLIGES